MENIVLDIELVLAVMSGKVSSAINRRMYQDFRSSSLDITPEQWSILVFLWQQDRVTQRTIADATYKDRPSVTRLIDNMERQGLVTRTQDREDRRTNKICLTERGINLQEKVREITLNIMQDALKGLSLEDITKAQYFLRKIFSNFQDKNDVESEGK